MAITKESVTARFNELEAHKKELAQKITEINQEQFRLAGEYRLLVSMEKKSRPLKKKKGK